MESYSDDLAEYFATDSSYNTVTYEQKEILNNIIVDGSVKSVSYDPPQFELDLMNPIYTPKEEYREYVERIIAEGFIRVSINALGEGMINVCEINGDIMNGDYITLASRQATTACCKK